MLAGKSPEHMEWLVFEDGIDRHEMRLHETLFTLGNGYVGSRGILEEGYEEAYPGTYFAAVYNRSGEQPSEIVNAPNPICLEIRVDGKKLSLDNMQVIKHSRVLDMKRAVLERHTTFVYGDRRYEYESTRFFSIKNMHVAVMVFSFRSLDSDVKVSVRQILDGTTRNEIRPIGKPVKHYVINQKFEEDGIVYLEARTKESGISIGMASLLDTKGISPEVSTETRLNGESIERELSFVASKGKRYVFSNYICLHTSKNAPYVRKTCFREARLARRTGVSLLLSSHTAEWDKRWEVCDVKIAGDPSSQLALRFNIYHLLIAAPPNNLDASIPARTLSGEWYKGHIFWDTETYVLPFYIYTQPETAENLLLYRARRIEEAREGAEKQGYKGALWPWESALTGSDETPDTWVNFDGTTIPVYNKTREHHIASDVIYAVALYYQVSKRDDFMLRFGLEMVFETARFWASRVAYSEDTGKYEIKNVIGPNEFQHSVDNNSYTNYLAKWLLNYACRLYYDFRRNYPREVKTVIEKTGLREDEVNSWQGISEAIVFLQRNDGLIEEFKGYFKRKDITIERFASNGMPIWPPSVRLSEVQDTQLVKQADVLLLLHLFPLDFSQDHKRKNLEYYRKRTTHKSSLSIPSHAIIAVEADRLEAARKYFSLAVRADLENVYGNTHQGIHAASLGGTWQIAVTGFAGLRLKDDVLSINPKLPPEWEELSFRIWFRQALIELRTTGDTTEVFLVSDKGRMAREIQLEIYGRVYALTQRRSVTATTSGNR